MLDGARGPSQRDGTAIMLLGIQLAGPIALDGPLDARLQNCIVRKLLE